MTVSVTIDDDFVLAALRDAERMRALVGWPLRRSINRKIDACLATLRKHQGAPRLGPRSPTISPVFATEQILLNRSMRILGNVLNMPQAITGIQQVIETDWLAHLALDKDKRYRDHIVHPVRVTGIGWWLLHRSGLLNALARYYSTRTRSYCRDRGIDLGVGAWREIVEYAWLASGMLHDAAYPLEYFLRGGRRLASGLGDPQGVLEAGAERLVNGDRLHELEDRLESSWFATHDLDLRSRLTGARRAKFKHSHGLLGALHQLLPVNHGRDGELHCKQGLVRQLAARAIITHHDESHAMIISDPLATLLVVADSLQVWKRRFMHRERSRPGSDVSTIRPLVECERMVLVACRRGFQVRFFMNCNEAGVLKKAPYRWSYDRFREPNRRIQQMVAAYNRHMRRYNRGDGQLPRLLLTGRECIQPARFLRLV